MIETVVSSTFNFFDIFVRLGPGCILVGCFYCCFNKVIPSMNMDSTFVLVLNITIAYLAGTLVRAPFRLVKDILDNWYFGGNPRDIYTTVIKKPVIKEEITRKVAKKLVDQITDQLELKDVYDKGGMEGKKAAENTNSLTDKEKRNNHFAFSHMVNCLELSGKSGKADRICGLLDMCAYSIVTLAICAIMLGISTARGLGLDWNETIHPIFIVIIMVIIFTTGIVSSLHLYYHYTQMRFSMIVQQYNIWKSKQDLYSCSLLNEKIMELEKLSDKIERLKKAIDEDCGICYNG